MELNEELVDMMKSGAPFQDVNLLFNELYNKEKLEPREYMNIYNLYMCHLLHYGYQSLELDIDALLTVCDYNPAITAVHENKMWFLKLMFLYAFDRNTDVISQYTVSSTKAITSKIFAPAYGVFEDDVLQTDQKTTTLDILLAQDNAAWLGEVLNYNEQMAPALLVHAARYRASRCCKALQEITETHAKSNILYDILDTVITVSDIGLENAVYLFTSIKTNFSHTHNVVPSLLDAKDIAKIADFEVDIATIQEVLYDSNTPDFTAISKTLKSSLPSHDFELFSKVVLESIEIILGARTAESSGDKPYLVSCEDHEKVCTALKALYDTPWYVLQDRRLFSVRLLIRIIKCMMHYGVEPMGPQDNRHFHTFLDCYKNMIQRNEIAAVSVTLVELYRIYAAYGQIPFDHFRLKTELSWNRHYSIYHPLLLQATRLIITLLPKELYDKYRGWVMTNAMKLKPVCVQRNSAAFQCMSGVINELWNPLSLQELCRNKLYQILPTGQVPTHVQQLEIPQCLMSYLTFETDEIGWNS